MSEIVSAPAIGVALAVVSATALAIGNMMQARGVHKVEDDTAAAVAPVATAATAVGSAGSGNKALRLVSNRIWLLGAALIGASTLFQLASLTFAPLMVVQPLGVIALVITALVTAYLAKRAPSVQVVRSIAFCVIGVAAFVTVAALVTTQHAITNTQLIAILAVLCVVLLATGIIMLVGRKGREVPLLWVLLGGVYSAFVATLGKTVIMRVQAVWKSHNYEFSTANVLTLGCLLGIAVAGGLSIYFVQRAHVANRPEVVVAGLTVVDPAIAVVLSITILGEASNAPWWAAVAFVVAGSVAIGGVFALSNAEGITDEHSIADIENGGGAEVVSDAEAQAIIARRDGNAPQR